MCVDAVRGVNAIRIEMVRVTLLRHHPHTLSGAGSSYSLSVCVSMSASIRSVITQGTIMRVPMSKLLGQQLFFFSCIIAVMCHFIGKF